MSAELLRELTHAKALFQARTLASVLGAPSPQSLPQYDRNKVQSAYDAMISEREADQVHAEYESGEISIPRT